MTEDRKKELVIILNKMSCASTNFYQAATALHHHPFIEFTGIINEYIDCCRGALLNGIDFTECSTHTGKSLPTAPHQIKYINEKLECIFTGSSFMKEKLEHEA